MQSYTNIDKESIDAEKAYRFALKKYGNKVTKGYAAMREEHKTNLHLELKGKDAITKSMRAKYLLWKN